MVTCLTFSSAVLIQGDLKDAPSYLDIDRGLNFSEIIPELNVNIPKLLLNAALSKCTGATMPRLPDPG